MVANFTPLTWWLTLFCFTNPCLFVAYKPWLTLWTCLFTFSCPLVALLITLTWWITLLWWWPCFTFSHVAPFIFITWWITLLWWLLFTCAFFLVANFPPLTWWLTLFLFTNPSLFVTNKPWLTHWTFLFTFSCFLVALLITLTRWITLFFTCDCFLVANFSPPTGWLTLFLFTNPCLFVAYKPWLTGLITVCCRRGPRFTTIFPFVTVLALAAGWVTSWWLWRRTARPRLAATRLLVAGLIVRTLGTLGRLVRLFTLVGAPVALLVWLAVLAAGGPTFAYAAPAIPAGRCTLIVARHLHAEALAAPLGLVAVHVGRAVGGVHLAPTVDTEGARRAGLPGRAPLGSADKAPSHAGQIDALLAG